MSEKLKEFFKNYYVKSICSICKDSGFYLQLDEDVPSGLVCIRDSDRRKFECSCFSGFNMKPKLDWFKFRVANIKTGFWEYYKVANYIQGKGYFEELDEVEVTDR